VKREPKEIIALITLAIFVFGITIVALYILKPFYSPAIFAIPIAISLNPLRKFLLKILRGREKLTAFLITLFVFLLMVGILLPVSITLINETRNIYLSLRENFEERGELWTDSVDDIFSSFPEEWRNIIYSLILKIADYIKSISKAFLGFTFSLIKGTFALAFKFFMFFVFIFFFVKDGEKIVKFIFDYIPLDEEIKKAIKDRLTNTFSSVFLGTFTTAFVQGILAGIGFLILRVPYPAILGVLAGICSIIPFGGTALVWMPAAIYLFLKGEILRGVLQLLWGSFIVSTIDNILKPLIIGKEMKISFLWMLLFILGGIKIFGITGIFLGPIVLSLLKVVGESLTLSR
jgi:predicted PurR-regulated permease PerM